MPTIMCTLDLWRRLGYTGSPPARLESGNDGTRLGDWSAKAVDEPDGSYCLAVNEKTYLTIVFPLVGLPRFHEAFASAVGLELAHLGIPPSTIALETKALLGQSVFGKNTNRSLLGSLNDVGRCFSSDLDVACGAAQETLVEIQHEFNMMPHIGREEPFPAHAVAELLGQGGNSRAV